MANGDGDAGEAGAEAAGEPGVPAGEAFDVAAAEAEAAEGIVFADPEEEALFHSTDEPDQQRPGFESWRRRSGTGSVLTGVALGLQMVFSPPQDPPAIVLEAPGTPPGPDDPYELHIDPDHPDRSTVVFRSRTGRRGAARRDGTDQDRSTTGDGPEAGDRPGGGGER